MALLKGGYGTDDSDEVRGAVELRAGNGTHKGGELAFELRSVLAWGLEGANEAGGSLTAVVGQQMPRLSRWNWPGGDVTMELASRRNVGVPRRKVGMPDPRERRLNTLIVEVAGVCHSAEGSLGLYKQSTARGAGRGATAVLTRGGPPATDWVVATR